MSEFYKMVDPVDMSLSPEQERKIASRLYLGNYGAVYPVGKRLVYEYQTGEHGGKVYKKDIDKNILEQLLRGELSEEALIDMLDAA